jgi:hypothetical protein
LDTPNNWDIRTPERDTADTDWGFPEAAERAAGEAAAGAEGGEAVGRRAAEPIAVPEPAGQIPAGSPRQRELL